MDINLERIKKVHFIGIGGIGLSAIARLMKEEGKEVSGSDLSPSLIIGDLKKRGIKIYIGQSKENISTDIDLVIYTTAVDEDNPELREAKEIGIRAITYPQALGLVFNGKFGIAVCGTHGKSSTTAMAGLLLDDAGFDPSVIVGSIIPQYGSNLRIGKGKYFVAEACEYKHAFLNLYPKIIILNNIELDHTDYYRDLEDIKNAFEKFVSHLPKEGILIVNGDDKGIQNSQLKTLLAARKVSGSKFNAVSFGTGSCNRVQASNIELGKRETRFEVRYDGKSLGKFALKMPGIFNVYNALAVVSLGLVLDIPTETIKRSLARYSGIWRRFEIKGEYMGALVISDYAHHPSAVRAVIRATKQFYPDRRILAVFQPHQHNRTKRLYSDFLSSFEDADVVILSEIFDVAGREEMRDQDVSSLDLVNDIQAKSRKTGRNIFYAKDLNETRKLIDKKTRAGDVLLIMGAGDIYKVADEITSCSKL